jgi:hypothetical protein
MSRNGSGTYNLPAGNPVVTGTTITTTWANSTLTDIASALTGSVAADGQTPMSGSLNMANNKVISVTDPTSAQDAATKAYVDLVAGGTKDGSFVNLAYTGTLTGGTGVVNLGSGQVYKDASGNVGIGTNNPATKLEVYGGRLRVNATPDPGIEFSNTATVKGYVYYDSTNDLMVMRHSSGTGINTDSSGNLLVGTTSLLGGEKGNFTQTSAGAVLRVINTNASFADTALSVSATNRTASSAFNLYTGGASNGDQFKVRGDGVIFAQNTTVQSISDVRTKENIVDSNEGIETVNALRPVRFDFKEGFGNDKKNQLGFIAQEIEQVFPDAVDTWGESNDPENPYKSVGTTALIPVLVKAIQEQQAMIEELKTKVIALEAK